MEQKICWYFRFIATLRIGKIFLLGSKTKTPIKKMISSVISLLSVLLVSKSSRTNWTQWAVVARITVNSCGCLPADQRFNSKPATHPADGEGDAGLARAHTHEAESQLPVEEVLCDECDKGQGHCSSQHVEHTCHVVYIQLTAHHLIFLIVADASEPQGLKFLHLTYKEIGKRLLISKVCFVCMFEKESDCESFLFFYEFCDYFFLSVSSRCVFVAFESFWALLLADVSVHFVYPWRFQQCIYLEHPQNCAQ